MLSSFIKSAAILLTLSTPAMAQEDQPEISHHTGIVAFEVHESPKVGKQEKEVIVVQSPANKGTECPANWTLTAGVCLPG
jgi:hypothetical protein